MKFLTFLAVSVLLISVGCVSIDVKKEEVMDDDGELHAVNTHYSYRRNLGSQNLEGVKFKKNKNGSIGFEIGKQSGESQLDSILTNLTGFMENLSKLAATGGVPVPSK